MYQFTGTRILKEDLGEDTPDWVDPILYQINDLTDYIKTAFSKNITVQENLINPYKQLTLISKGSPALDTLSFSVTLPAGYQPKGVQIINCIDNSGVIVGNAVTCEMTPGLANGNVVVRAIYGLTSGHSYTLTFLVY